ncbi:MAG TPA: pyrimidine 5'-nucleotidase [Phenylobacterium sp.]|jgi:putative hydrolase of the HAD superfamily|uniref:pyrimidine 5'-nucleotidase n=1 Tax=Phenylobacterium sp. TaxID=1871053 RepID=UPI002D4B30F8|nr:pyrimidine 5'-nucleotidase [Phenylobacterium sp.]HZZ69991.1 pyrimidine 5'-nucleotidase [Phenylobacterium sp.]
MGADLRHVDTWLFDLDNTLYPASSGFMRGLEERITAYVARVTALPRDEAYRLQKQYLADYGLTLDGLVKHHGVDPHEYHAIFDDLPLDVLVEDPELIAAIARLPGRRLIFTNANDVHADRVLQRLGLTHLFHDVFHIGLADYVPKPSRLAFERMDAALGVAPKTTAFFEDSERNLAPAAELGMTTVLVGPNAAASTAPFIHYKTDHLASFLMDALTQEAA